ncbi:MAG: prepilin-type N-terminal cleavage/methylation domain-containing protein, partial [Lachnospiraceae bacterium]
MRRSDARQMRQQRYYVHKNNKGFTLVEMIVTLVVLSILLSLSIAGLLAWQDWSNFNRENEYAQILYIAAQNQLAEFGADGRLEDLKSSLSGGTVDDKTGKKYAAVGLNLTDSISLIKNAEGEAYSLTAIYPESKNKTTESLYQDEIVSLRAKTGEYEQYLKDPEGLKASNPEAYWVFELVGSYVYDASVLNGSKSSDGSGNGASICIEITPEDGQVFSVLYSDLNDRFVYLNVPEDKEASAEGNGVADISDRTENYRRERMVGYYGVDTLYTATKNEMIMPALSGVKLYNKETFYLTCRLSAEYRTILTSQLTYIIDLNGSKNVNDKKLTLKLDGTRLKNAQNAEMVSCPVSRYDTDGTEIALGEFPVLAWVEPDYTVHVVLDAADIQATTELYERELEDIRSTDAADTKFAGTLSFFRFGVSADNVYASVTATGDGFTASKTVSNFGNLNVFKNQEAKHPVFAGEKEKEVGDGTEFTYSVINARHLYNIRYIEDLSYEKEAGSVEAAERIAGVTFLLKSDIDWTEFEKNGNLYNSYDTAGNFRLSSLNGLLVNPDGSTIDNVTRYNCDFPSVSQVRERDVIDGNQKTITGISVSEIANVLYGVYLSDHAGTYEMDSNRPTGFVNVNYGTIKDLKLDALTVSGFDCVGGFCGINAGLAENLETLNTDGNSLVAGRKHVGGIIGYQLPAQKSMDMGKLVNRAKVEGVEAVGGILGMIRNEFQSVGVDLTELKGLSVQTRQLITNPTELTIIIHDCENYGEIAGVNTSELREIYTESGTAGEAGNEGPEEPRYIGGIVGYCYNQDEENTGKITIEKCISSPQYDSESLILILSDRDKLNSRLKGVYVGGVAGYNYFGQINQCSTQSQKGREGYLFGYRYVGGIVGFNIGPASGIIGGGTSKQGENTNHVIAYEYAGGITGCNAGVRDKDSENHDISMRGAKDPEKLTGLLLPDSERNLHVKIDNWINKGVIIAVHAYSGGITGYNAGYIYRCNSTVKAATADTCFTALYSGNYAGGIAGYNNGVIGNTERIISADGKNSTVAATGNRFSTVCYVKGHHYVGGIVGYNDVDSIVEDYEIASGYVLGDEGSCFVGGYAGLNASVDLLMNMSGEVWEARFIHSNPNRVEGSYFVGGNIGGNIINMADNTGVHRINGVFLTDNFLGILEGKAFVGGFVGYNLLFDNTADDDWIRKDAEGEHGGVYIVQRELVDAFEKSDASSLHAEESLTQKKEILDHLPEKLGLSITPSNKMVFLSGQGAESTKVSFGTISGEIYVGGVMGYNDENTRLYVNNVENATPIEATASILYAAEQILATDEETGENTYRETDYSGNPKIYRYSYAGGILGKTSKDTTLDNCW